MADDRGQGGFVIGTLVSARLNLPDIVNPRRLFAIGCALGAAANAALVVADGTVPLIEYSPRDHIGAALTVQTCTGFLLTMISIRLLPVAAQAIGWQ